MKIEYIIPKIKAILVPNSRNLCTGSQNTGGSSNEGFGEDGTGETELS